MKHIAVVGSWHNAFVTAACLAHIGHRVTLVSEASTLSIHEPGLDEMIAKSREEEKLNIVADSYDESVDVVWLAIDTPLRDDDSPNVEPLILALGRAQGRFSKVSLFVIGSQVPVGFCQDSEKRLGVPVACVPENMRIGSGVSDFLHPERVVIGATAIETRKTVGEMLPVTANGWFLCDLPTAEMIKHGTNAMLATQISLANELAKVGEKFGADTQLVAKAMKMDSRIGPRAYVRPGLGFAGGTLPRDLRALQIASRGDTAPLIDAVLRVNNDVVEHIAHTAMSLLPAAPRTLCIMGYTYKADTDTLRRSPVPDLSERIRQLGRCETVRRDPSIVLGGKTLDEVQQDVNVLGYDPRFMRGSEQSLGVGHMPTWDALERKADLPGGVDVFLVVTPLPEFKQLDWSRCAPAVVYDLCDGVDRTDALAAGLSYKAIWQPVESWANARATHDWAAPTGYVGYLMNQAHHALRRCKRCGVAYTQPLRDPITGVSGPYHVWKGETCDEILACP